MKGLYTKLMNKSAIMGLTVTIAEIIMITAILVFFGLYASVSEASVL